MMRADTTGMLRREFASRTQADAYRFFQQQEAEARKQRERRDDTDKEADDLIDLAVTVISVSQARELRFQIDRYGTASIEALQENERQMIELREELDEMLAKAHVLPDGRRVFKTEDGLRVFDEHGNELDASEIGPDEIANDRPRWEPYEARLNRLDALEAERGEIIEYQDKLDAARERLDAGDMTQEKYDRLQQDLVNEMPDAVRRQIPELADMEPETKPHAASTDNELDLPDDVVAKTTAPQAPIPGG